MFSREIHIPVLWTVAISILLSLGLVLLAALTLQTTREKALADELNGLARLSTLLANHAQRVVFGADLLVANLQERITTAGLRTPQEFAQYARSRALYDDMQRMVSLTTDADTLSVFDHQGRMLNSSVAWPTPDISIGDRDHFTTLRDGAAADYVISAPVKNRITGQTIVIMARRINGPQGEFLGTVNVIISTSRFEKLYASVLPGAEAVISLSRRDGTLLSQEPPGRNAVGDHPEIKRFLQESATHADLGTLRAPPHGAEGAQLVAMHVVGGYPLLVSVTNTQAAALVEWWQLARVIIIVTSGAILFIFLLGYVLMRQWRLGLRILETETLRQLNEELEQRVQQRTGELVVAKDEAERASRAKSDFLSRMSHELRTPLNAILGFSQLLQIDRQQPLTAAQADNVQEILQAGAHLLELINEVLDLARIEAGKLSVSREPVALLPVLGECLTLIRPLSDARGIRIDETDAACDVAVRADRTRLKQVLLNLLSNAVKYNLPRGAVRITCVPGADVIEIRISDTGPGLSPAQQAGLFVTFERLGAEQQGIEGTGIGLALSKRLVELMQGEIGVDSAPGRGSTFWLRLPRAREAAAETATPAPATPGASVPPAVSGRTWRVLCIEDNPSNLRLIERLLEQRADIRLFTAQLPQAGIDLAVTKQPDLILLDINLPGMDGYDVLDILRRSEATRRIPVVAISANATAPHASNVQAAFDDFLTKPLQVEQLTALIDRYLPREGAAST